MMIARKWLLGVNFLSLFAIVLLGKPQCLYFLVFSFFATAGVCALIDIDRRLPAAPEPKEPSDRDDAPEFRTAADGGRLLWIDGLWRRP